jgi:hypothetical protein
MKLRARKVLWSLSTVASILVVVGFVDSRASVKAEGWAPVKVINTPLPVSLTGTGMITGSVNAYQADAWSVGVTSLPSVQLAPGTTVEVTGTVGDSNAKNAFAGELCVDAGAGCGSPLTIPVNKRFVIEQVSGECDTSDEEDFENWVIKVHLNGTMHDHYFKSPIRSAFHFATRIYADAPDITVRGIQSGFHDNNECDMTLSGYLVDTTPPFP